MTSTRFKKSATFNLFVASMLSSLVAIMLCVTLCMGQLGMPIFAHAHDADVDAPAAEGFASDDAGSLAIQPAADSATKQFAPITRDASANAANLVLIVELTDSPADSYYNQLYPTAGSRYRTNLDYLNAQLNDLPPANMKQQPLPLMWSYRSYLDIISKGKFNVASYIPQAYDDGTFMPIHVDMSSSQVQNNGSFDSASVITKALAALKIARPDLDASVFDVNGDGVIDNVVLILDLPAEKTVTAHASTYAGETSLTGAGKQIVVRPYTALPGGASGSSDRFNPSVAVHERMHTLGARDYYRGGVGKEEEEGVAKSGNPVGMWDVMSQGGSYAWPLAFTRKQVGWITIPELNLSGSSKTVTLFAPVDADDDPSSKPQSFIIKLPSSSSEYFVIEYRKKGGEIDYFADPLDTTPHYDRSIGASGLIVYRVNEKWASEGNIGGNDYVYVFRPGETSLTSSAGDIKRAPIAAGAYATQGGVSLNSSIGSLDAGAQITDGAICYSDGRNSGLKITAKSQTDNSITVTIEQAQVDESTAWMPVLSADGSAPFSTVSSPSTKLATDGANVYALSEGQGSNGSWSVYEHDGSNWSKLGATQTGIANVDIAWFNGSLYAIGSRTSGSATELRKFSGGSWTTVATVAKGDPYAECDLLVAGGKLHALVSVNGVATVYDCSSGSSFASYGPNIPTNSVTHPTLVDIGGKAAVVAGSTATSPWKTGLYVLNGSAWKEAILFSNGAAAVISSAKIGAKTYVYAFANASTNVSTLYEVDSTGSVTKATPVSQVTGSIVGASLSSDGADLYLCLATGSQGTVAFKMPNGQADKAVQVDDKVYSAGGSVDSIVLGKKMLVAIGDTTAKTVVVRSHAVAPSSGESPSDPVTPQPAKVAIIFDANGGSGAPTNLNGEAGATIYNKWPTTVPVRSGYEFIGWYTEKADGKGTKVTAYPAKYPAQSITYYAHWKKQSPSGNAGSGNSGSGSDRPSDSVTTEVMYRMYNPNSGEHFYTARVGERDSLKNAGWSYEGVAWTAPKTSNTPVYRLYSGTDHHYTKSKAESDALVKVGWKYEGIGWYSDDQKRVGLHRLYNPNVDPKAARNNSGSHHYTISSAEKDNLVKAGWVYENIGWFGL